MRVGTFLLLNDMKAAKIDKEQQEPIKSRSEVVQSQNGEDDKLVGAEAMTPFPQKKRDNEGKATAPPPSANRPTEAKPREALHNERKIEKLTKETKDSEEYEIVVPQQVRKRKFDVAILMD